MHQIITFGLYSGTFTIDYGSDLPSLTHPEFWNGAQVADAFTG